MALELGRLRRGEWIAGAGAVVLLASMFLLPWYRVTSGSGASGSQYLHPVTVDGWQALTTIRWLMLATIVASFALVYFQASRRAPAIPVAMSLIVTVLGTLTALVLIVRVLIDLPSLVGNVSTRAGAYVGLLSAIVIAGGGYASLREEGIAPDDEPGEVPTVRLPGRGGS
ncbi:MAG: hypothetical protein JO181_12755 [Solirubrobacterales bacterium]|nr:hypothetical protein [Solirubrobacterales bacterium]